MQVKRVQRDTCLGGTGSTSSNKESNEPSFNLSLHNSGSSCFVNSVIQMLRKTEYTSFLRNYVKSGEAVKNVRSCETEKRYRLICCFVSILDKVGSTVSVSTDELRSLVASISGLRYLDNGTQQDACEFLETLEAIFTQECSSYEQYNTIKDMHIGTQSFSRHFKPFSGINGCQNCGLNPAERITPFFILPVAIPRHLLVIKLSTLLNNHFSVSKEVVKMRCLFCCEKQNHPPTCPRTGVCEEKEVSEKLDLLKAPQLLIVHLRRSIFDEPKLLTRVEFDNNIILQNGCRYEPIATIDHIGKTQLSGHYITFLKFNEDKWIKFDDKKSQECSRKDANSSNNYIILLKKMDESLNSCGSLMSNIQETPRTLHLPPSVPAKTEQKCFTQPSNENQQAASNKVIISEIDTRIQEKQKSFPDDMWRQELETILKKKPGDRTHEEKLKYNRFRKRILREKQTVEKRNKENEANKERNSVKRSAQIEIEAERERLKDKERRCIKRTKQSDEEAKVERLKDKERRSKKGLANPL